MAFSTKPGTLGAIYMESATTTMTDEATTANVAKTIFTITASSKRLISLDPSDEPEVKYGTVPVVQTKWPVLTGSVGYVIDYAAGTITFKNAAGVATTPGTEAVTITGKYVTMTLLPGFTKFSIDTSVGIHDVTQFVATNDANYGWRRIIGALGEWSASADGFIGNDDILALVAVALSTPKHFQFVLDQTNMSSFLYGQGSCNKVDVDDPVAGVITQNLSILSSSTLYRIVA
jgi:predicted secreted protein